MRVLLLATVGVVSASCVAVPRGIAAALGFALGVLALNVRRSRRVLDLAAIGRAGLEARGLLGLNFLKDRRTVDFETSIVRFDPPGSPGAVPGS